MMWCVGLLNESGLGTHTGKNCDVSCENIGEKLDVFRMTCIRPEDGNVQGLLHFGGETEARRRIASSFSQLRASPQAVFPRRMPSVLVFASLDAHQIQGIYNSRSVKQ